ncbi:MAG: hypothetical protein V4590_03080 [Bacteroidota bacterium]
MKPSLLYFISALLFCCFLGFIDEGYYSLQTFKDPWNIAILLVYALFFWGIQLGLHWLLRNVSSISMPARKTIVIIVGLLVPIIIILMLANPAN